MFINPLLIFNGFTMFISPEKKLFPGLFGDVPGFGFGLFTVFPILLSSANDGPA
ncbi:hypothetical protein AAIB48_17330 [Paraclostridium benzoelyticum]|uniref:hypothetical protein n=1 Tax=Paraclostridium benzoelyticum TaxID=1629550 RepID=UPI0031CDA4B9